MDQLPPSPRRLRVLIVDDYDDARDSLCILLQLLGHACATAPNAEAALKTAAAFLPDVVIMGLALPGTDGYEAARLLRALPGLSGVRIVAITGQGLDEYVQRSREAGFVAHLVKPADPVVLQKLLKQLGPVSDAAAV